MIDSIQFDETLRKLLDQVPFAPFVVELQNGAPILVRRPPVAYGGGSAAFIDPADGALIQFDHCKVIAIRPAASEVGA